MMFLGIDWGKQHNHAFMLDETDEVLLDLSFPTSREGVTQLLAQVGRRTGDPRQVAVAIETNQGILVEVLQDYGFQIHPVNPKTSERFRQAMSAVGKKSDRIDAQVLARFLKQFHRDLAPLPRESALLRELRSLVGCRHALVADKVRLENRLTAILSQYFPAALEAYDDFSAVWVLDALERFPTPEEAQRGLAQLVDHIRARHAKVSPKTLRRVARKLTAPALSARAATAAAESQQMLWTLSSLRQVRHHIHEVEKQITRLFDQHPDAAIFRSLPQAGKTLGPRLLTQLGEDRRRFLTPEALSQLAGVAPVTRRSGKSTRVAMRLACSKSFRHTMRTLSDLTRRIPHSWARAYYDRRRQAGDAHETALRKLAARWMKIIWRLWQDGTTYQEEIHVRNQMARQSPKAREESTPMAA